MVIAVIMCYIIYNRIRHLLIRKSLYMPHPSIIRQNLYESLPFVERMAMDRRDMEARQKREAEIVASDRTDEVANLVRLGFSEDFIDDVREWKSEQRAIPVISDDGTTAYVPVLKLDPQWRLSDQEADLVLRCVPKGGNGKGVGQTERVFLDICNWWMKAQEVNLTWQHLPSDLGNAAGYKSRMREWQVRGWFNLLYGALLETPGLSPARLAEFAALADREIVINREHKLRKGNKAVVKKGAK
jgi:hypothetical protein